VQNITALLWLVRLTFGVALAIVAVIAPAVVSA
jgi:hypothetical protein